MNHVVPAEVLLDEAMAFAWELAHGPGLAIRWTKMTINRLVWNNVNLALEMGMAAQGMAHYIKDHFEALVALEVNREPRFRSE